MAQIQPESIIVRAPGFGGSIKIRASASDTLESLNIADWVEPGQGSFEIEIPPALKNPLFQLRSSDSADASPEIEVTIPVPAPGTILLVEHPDGTLQFITPEEPSTFRSNRPELMALAAATPSVSFRIPIHSEPGTDRLNPGRKTLNLFGGLRKVVFWIIKKAVGLAVPLIEKGMKSESFQLLPGTSVRTAGGDCLVLTHGIFSSIRGAFGSLPIGYIQNLSQKYPGGIWGFDHWTVQKSPLDNATDLQKHLRNLQPLPESQINLVCHSRGGTVHRCLLEHPTLVGGNVGLNFKKAYFVAGANQGSDLANVDNVVKLVNGYLALSQIALSVMGLPAVGAVVKFLGELLLAAGKGLASQPGVAALDPASSMYGALNGPAFTPLHEYIFSGANFDPKSLGLKVLDDMTADWAFKNKPNDVVVPFMGTGAFDSYISAAKIPVVAGPIYGDKDNAQGKVHHLNFFVQPEIQETILAL